MATDKQPNQDQEPSGTPPSGGQEAATGQAQAQGEARGEEAGKEQFDGLKDKKPEELTPEELRLMADTMPGEGPGD